MPTSTHTRLLVSVMCNDFKVYENAQVLVFHSTLIYFTLYKSCNHTKNALLHFFSLTYCKGAIQYTIVSSTRLNWLINHGNTSFWRSFLCPKDIAAWYHTASLCWLLCPGIKNGGLQHQKTYYVTVIAVNKVGLTTMAFSKPLVVDNTPPQVCGKLTFELWWDLL